MPLIASNTYLNILQQYILEKYNQTSCLDNYEIMPILCFIEEYLLMGPICETVECVMDNIAYVVQQHCKELKLRPQASNFSQIELAQYLKRLNFLSHYANKINEGVKIDIEPRAASSSSIADKKFVSLLSQSEFELRTIVKSGLLIYFLEKETHKTFLQMMALKEYTPSTSLQDSVLLANFIFTFIPKSVEPSASLSADNQLHLKLTLQAFARVKDIKLKLDFLKDTQLGSITPLVKMQTTLFELAKKDVMVRAHEYTVGSITNLLKADPNVFINVNILRYITVPGEAMQIVRQVDKDSIELLCAGFRVIYRELYMTKGPALELVLSEKDLLSTLQKRCTVDQWLCRCSSIEEFKRMDTSTLSSRCLDKRCTLGCRDILDCLTNNLSQQPQFNLQNQNLSDQIDQGLTQLYIDRNQELILRNFTRVQVNPHSLILRESKS